MENKPEYTHCTVTEVTSTGIPIPHIAKVDLVEQRDGSMCWQPTSVLINGEWSPMDEFRVKYPNYSCDNYRQTEQVRLSSPEALPTPPSMYSRPAYCTVLTLNAGRFIAKAGDFTDSDGTFFGPISMLVNGEWMDRADFEEKFGILRSEDYRKEEAMPGTIWPKKKDITEIETTKPTDTTITTTFTKQEEPLPLPEVTPEMKNAADAAFRSLSTTFTLQADYGYPKIFASTDFNAPAFGTRIQLYRESLILSRRKAAAQMNINESAVAAIEAGTYHGIDEIAKAAKWVGLTASEMGAFFGLEDPNKPERSWSGTTTILILLFILTWILVWNL